MTEWLPEHPPLGMNSLIKQGITLKHGQIWFSSWPPSPRTTGGDEFTPEVNEFSQKMQSIHFAHGNSHNRAESIYSIAHIGIFVKPSIPFQSALLYLKVTLGQIDHSIYYYNIHSVFPLSSISLSHFLCLFFLFSTISLSWLSPGCGSWILFLYLYYIWHCVFESTSVILSPWTLNLSIQLPA